jgi:hypothetical protein
MTMAEAENENTGNGRVYACVARRERRYIAIIKKLIAGDEITTEDEVFLNKNENRTDKILKKYEATLKCHSKQG